MAEDRLTQLLREAHGGEVLGATLFGELAGRATDPDRRRKLAACRLLEEQTATTIAALAADHGVELGEAGDKAEVGRSAATTMAELDWPTTMAAIADGTGAYRSLYAQLLEVVADPDNERVAEIVAHEQALSGFARAEADGDPDAIERLLAALTPSTLARLPTG
ncbi:hypothetical protein [Rhabdothermincola salaria]|uniref:hypothetical protein n=1 Tax=Rhabdothermincola salaria TaxID=2903142 RepID=UPI001E604E64|nr:hypothetical protein [Rhabdothermincola salaria]MCD9622823.1 hypothetical protein [Rhabdothermincola salaria]